MTIREKAICECYTGVCFCVREERNEVYKYLGELFGRPIQTLEILTLSEEIKNRSRGDFLAVCAGVYSDAVKRGEWRFFPYKNTDKQVVCSVCGHREYNEINGEQNADKYAEYNHCPHCGAQMREYIKTNAKHPDGFRDFSATFDEMRGLVDEIRGLVDGALHNVEKILGEQEVKENEID